MFAYDIMLFRVTIDIFLMFIKSSYRKSIGVTYTYFIMIKIRNSDVDFNIIFGYDSLYII